MTRQRTFIRELLADLFVFALLNCLAASALLLLRGKLEAFMSLALALPFFLMTLIRRKSRSFLLFAAAHIALLVSPLLLPLDIISMALWVVTLLISLIYSTVTRVKGGWSVDIGVTLVSMALAAVLSILLEHLGFPGLTGLLTAWAFVMAVCHLVHLQTGQVDQSLDVLSGAAGQPLRVMLRFNNAILAAFLVPVALAAAASFFVPMDQILRSVGAVLMRFLRWLAAVISSLFSEKPPAEIEEEAAAAESPMPLEIAPPKETPEWLELLETILYYALHAALAIGIALLIIYSIYRLYKRFYASASTDGDLREYIGPELRRERLGGLWKNIRDNLPSFGADEREKIRRAYFRRVRRHIRKGADVRPADTTGQISGKILPREDISALTDRYNQARYGRD